MKKIKLTNSEVKEELLEMLKELHDFLSIHGIRYTIMSGTFLGCIRHSGFIPWDDDIDIGMLREDYDKLICLIKENKNQISSDINAISFELGNGIWPFLKIVNNKITVKESNASKEEKLWIDIFPFDNVLSNSNHYVNIIDKTTKRVIIKKINRQLGVVDLKRSRLAYSIYDKICDIFSRIIPTKAIIQFHLNRCKIFNKQSTNYVCDMVWGTKTVEKKLFVEIVDYKFEGINVKGIKDYDTYLSNLYGDYMQLPPIEKRVNHGIKAWREYSNDE